MKTIVITGSTRGIGYGMAEAFLEQGCAVTLNGRSQASVDRAAAALASRYSAERVFGFPGDASSFEQLQALWDAAKAHFEAVDIWVNNAGAANPQAKFWDQSPELIRSVVETNLLGAMYGSVIAMRGMIAQGHGALYNMEGYGSSGRRMTEGLALYGSTKAGLRFFDDNLMQEAKGTPVIVGALQPGMVATEMLSSQYAGKPQDWERAKRIFNILADPVDEVAPWLVQKMLANTQNGQRFSRINSAKIFWRFLSAPFIKRKVFE